MFTGIVEELGSVRSLVRRGRTAVISVSCSTVLGGTKAGDSIAVNGVCLTVTTLGDDVFSADVSDETLRVTSLGGIRPGVGVNLERAVRLGDRLSGHIVSGHVDAAGTVIERQEGNEFSAFRIGFERRFAKYVVEKGSVAVDGISLTANGVDGDSFRLAVIPHTLRQTTLQFLRAGDRVNLEFDVIGKYVERMIAAGRDRSGVLTESFLANAGFHGGK